MEFNNFLIIFSGLLMLSPAIIGSPFDNLSMEDTVKDLKARFTAEKERLDKIERKMLADNEKLLRKIKAIETKYEEEIKKRILEVEMRLLKEAQQAHNKSDEALERVLAVEQEVKSAVVSKIGISEGGSTESGTEGNDVHLQKKMKELENWAREMNSSFSSELKETADQTKRLTDELASMADQTKRLTDELASKEGAEKRWSEERKELLERLEKLEKSSLESKNDLSLKIQELEKANRDQRLELSAKMEEAQGKTSDMEKEFLRRIDEVKINTQDMLNSSTASRKQSEAVIRKNITEVARNLELFLNDSLNLGFQEMHSNFTAKIRDLERKIQKDYANSSYVSKMDESAKAVQTQFQTLRSQLEDRYEELNKTLTNHSSLIIVLNKKTLDIEEGCDGDPPVLPNGKAINLERKHGSNVTYDCFESYVRTSRSTVQCNRGHWEGQPPVCSYFDATFHLRITFWPTNGISCNSAFNYQNITISRVLDTGSGTDLPGRVSTGPSYAKLIFEDRFSLHSHGAFQCGFSDERGSMNIVGHMQNFTGDLYFEDRSKVANIGDAVDLEVKSKKDRTIVWRHDGVDVPSWRTKGRVEIRSVQPSDAGIYECNYEGERGVTVPALLRLIVRKCKKNLFGDHCGQQCPACYNGGICHDHLGVCVCPPGFKGKNCEVACYTRDESPNCRYEGDWLGSVYCLPDPYGCSCAGGRKGRRCYEQCKKGWYGADCKQPCHCALGSEDCEIRTGACELGCSLGWTGQSCQIQVDD